MRTLAWLLLVPILAWGGPGETAKATRRRAEARAAVASIVEGGNAASAASRLRYLGEERFAAIELADELRKSVDDRQRRNIVYALSLLETKAAEPALLASLEDEDGAVRMSAVQGLARIGSKRVDAIRPLLSDKTMGVRRDAARALGASRNPKMGKVLLRAAKTEGEVEARAAMLVAVGQCGDQRAAPELEAFLSHSSESTRHAAAQGLILLGAKKGFEYAQRLLQSADKLERRQALDLLEGANAKAAAFILKPLLNDQDHAVAARAARILFQGGDRAMLEWLVLASHHARIEDKLPYEAELEKLRLADDQRRAILAKAGIR